MKWFRRHIKTGSRLALLALALQFLLSFGHFHRDAAPAATATIQGQIDLADDNGQVLDVAGHAQQQPAGHDNGQPSNEPCAICAVIAMANQMVFGTLAMLPLPDAVGLQLVPISARSADPAAPWPAFRSRAPPVS